jgi:ABC-type Fe3+/spermidine/putrescine transport system ATPase subunit
VVLLAEPPGALGLKLGQDIPLELKALQREDGITFM